MLIAGVFTPGILMILQAYYGENKVWSVMIFTTALTLNGAVTGGYLGNGLDIAPNFSGAYSFHLMSMYTGCFIVCVFINTILMYE